jgi:transposase-like protein
MRCFRTRGKKGEKHPHEADPPRRRANKKRGHGTYYNDRPPVVGTIGRRSGKCRLRVAKRTDKRTLHQHVEKFTTSGSTCYSDEWQGYNRLSRRHRRVSHSEKEWARDDDGDGIREVHINTIEGLWQTVRNFLRPFRGVHKKSLHHYIALCEHRINRKRISPSFISQLVKAH